MRSHMSERAANLLEYGDQRRPGSLRSVVILWLLSVLSLVSSGVLATDHVQHWTWWAMDAIRPLIGNPLILFGMAMVVLGTPPTIGVITGGLAMRHLSRMRSSSV